MGEAVIAKDGRLAFAGQRRAAGVADRAAREGGLGPARTAKAEIRTDRVAAGDAARREERAQSQTSRR